MECRKGGRGGRRYGVKGWSVGREGGEGGGWGEGMECRKGGRRYGVKGWSVGREGGEGGGMG